MKVVRYRSLYILCVLCSHHEGKRVMYRITEYKPLLDSSNMMETDWMKIASDLFVSTIAYHNYTYKLWFNIGEEILKGLNKKKNFNQCNHAVNQYSTSSLFNGDCL